MKQMSLLIASAMLVFLTIGCAEKQTKPQSTFELRQEQCPWCINEPHMEGDMLYFVGLSKVYAAEQDARNDARKNAIRSVVTYIGAALKVKVEEARVSYGLSSDAIDSVGVMREFEKMLAQSLVSRLKTEKWYMEREETATGKGYKYFVLAKLPKSSIDNPYKAFAERKKAEAEQKARDAKLNDQAKKASQFWDDMTKQGFVE